MQGHDLLCTGNSLQALNHSAAIIWLSILSNSCLNFLHLPPPAPPHVLLKLYESTWKYPSAFCKWMKWAEYSWGSSKKRFGWAEVWIRLCKTLLMRRSWIRKEKKGRSQEVPLWTERSLLQKRALNESCSSFKWISLAASSHLLLRTAEMTQGQCYQTLCSTKTALKEQCCDTCLSAQGFIDNRISQQKTAPALLQHNTSET